MGLKKLMLLICALQFVGNLTAQTKISSFEVSYNLGFIDHLKDQTRRHYFSRASHPHTFTKINLTDYHFYDKEMNNHPFDNVMAGTHFRFNNKFQRLNFDFSLNSSREQFQNGFFLIGLYYEHNRSLPIIYELSGISFPPPNKDIDNLFLMYFENYHAIGLNFGYKLKQDLDSKFITPFYGFVLNSSATITGLSYIGEDISHIKDLEITYYPDKTFLSYTEGNYQKTSATKNIYNFSLNVPLGFYLNLNSKYTIALAYNSTIYYQLVRGAGNSWKRADSFSLGVNYNFL